MGNLLLAAEALVPRKGPSCSVCSVLSKLDGETLTDLQGLITSDRYTATTVYDACVREQIINSEVLFRAAFSRAVLRHRKNQCPGQRHG